MAINSKGHSRYTLSVLTAYTQNLYQKTSNETVIHTAVKDTVIISDTVKDLIALFAGHVARMYLTDRYHPN
jgi:hypothetical protein